jgi:hypothetical protein
MLLESFLNLVFLNSEFVEPYTKYLDHAIDEFEYQLEITRSSAQIREILSLEPDFYLPVPLMVDTYEKYLSLNRRDPEILRDYADYIDAIIPDWKDYAEKLTNEADGIEPNA